MISDKAAEEYAIAEDDDTDFAPTEQDRSMLEEVAAVVKRHNVQGRWAMLLAHHHFDVSEDEVMIESVDRCNRKLTIEPRRLTALDSDSLTFQTVYRFDGKAGRFCPGCK